MSDTTPRNRIVKFGMMKARDLVPDPQNFRTHPDAQLAALDESLARLGWIDVVKARVAPDGRLMIFDGHARHARSGPDDDVPTIVTDLDEDEARFALATHDAIATMAGIDGTKLGMLTLDLEIETPELSALLAGMAERYRMEPGNGDDGQKLGPEVGTTEFWHQCPSCGHRFQK
jgi:hypothetical protein